MSPERKLFDIVWNLQRKESHRINEALLTGREHGGDWRRGLMARIVFKELIDGNTETFFN